ncbi:MULTISPECIES: Stp1/IreP family PP2C-type Ser/Thr phosphatase [Caproicibacterium]|jgi:protein phosphatase|uniref:Stp1/IreP family PP2C-type Ser/Thr phosphatase n=1 Tax=Caproicibacterium lactatifermentans TaxID=2666138 RepID=A0A859DQ78_9FIRM|nr:Stp1/IreP family PP2C-type Ser/Thr phosphatase [Caproicibacterium lactatifermentans]ARP50281.1 phosphoprotein phosphatase [Ruminococcaceae bacterium CPB6]MDD4807902.1 Stp1/IreP family PP2C-type Ser/Thr phosphatase [Oscillospiraceae bacterium]QKN23998.1 Stp1/IreP family PP2C-type Ser/Thr phosphatase [Caproicibacterium lactatifermentans]QKO30931.1 Stp1/IreP family PP2C-type Ser/Thr phosphatase [Caproicibacterium lactatifermentans]
MFKVCHKTDIGLVRQSNQDACKSGLTTSGIAWAVVCDGMGGVNGGNIASSVAVEAMMRQYHAFFRENQSHNDDAIRELMVSAIYKANTAVYDRSREDEELKGMGTTVVSAIVCDGVARIAHAGDSRAYLVTPDEAKQITTDHSMVQELVDSGDLTEQQAKVHPQKNIITRALGIEPSVLVDYNEVPFEGRSLLILCTDGLSNYLEKEDLYTFSQQYTGQQLAEKLVSAAKESGGSDNITVAVIEN